MAEHQKLLVVDVSYDVNNPRITPLLEGWEEIDNEIVGQALQNGDDSFRKLKQAIFTTGGIINPIVVNHVGGEYTVIEGNTRLSIYKTFSRELPEDDRWKSIPATVREEMTNIEMDAIRLQAHLVGVTNWSPYAKAKYLHHLATSDHLPINDLIEFCGGNRNEVLRNIDAFKMMENEYRPAVEEKGGTFDQKKFSIFLEVQSRGLMASVNQAGFKRADFIDWVVENKFEPRQEYVRSLSKILSNPRALKEFQKTGAKKAILYLERPTLKKELLEARLVDLCEAVQTKLLQMPLTEVKDIRSDPEAGISVEDASIQLLNFYQNELKDR